MEVCSSLWGFLRVGHSARIKAKMAMVRELFGPPCVTLGRLPLIVDGVLVFNIWDNYSQRFLQDGDNGQNNVRLAVERWKNWWGGNLHSGPFNTHCIGHGLLRNWCLSQQPSPWLEPLSSLPCDTVLSDKDDFNQFNNDTMSPHQKKSRCLDWRRCQSQTKPTDESIPSTSPEKANSVKSAEVGDDESNKFQDQPIDIAVSNIQA
mmetsp:Transcript_44133/g.66531  ORF Transcript_44133/g.66531 Transcript_44133/m.66531 type:complete len:205 (+) Transcript_44133:160-774(+)